MANDSATFTKALDTETQKHTKGDTNLTGVAQLLTDAHAHQPSNYQQELQQATTAMHDKGLLPGLDIVGMKGQDMVVRDQNTGRVQLVDSTNTNSRHDQGISGGNTWQAESTTIGGRNATTNPDGTGTVTAGPGDKSPWVLSQAILKSQGIDNPTPNQMANYQLELEKANGMKVGQFKPGQEIKIPASTTTGDQTDFTKDRATAQTQAQKTTIDKQYDQAQKMLDKYGHSTFMGMGEDHITKDDITKALQDKKTPAADREGLQFLADNFDKLSKSNGPHGAPLITDTTVKNQKLLAEKQITASPDQ